MKRQYIKPETEIVHTQGLLAGDDYNFNTNSIDSGTDAGARGTTYRNENYIENPFRRYNPWE